MDAGSNCSRSTPLLGLARLISAMTAGCPPSIRERIAAANPRGAGIARASLSRAANGRATCAAITSSALVARIFARMSLELMAGGRFRLSGRLGKRLRRRDEFVQLARGGAARDGRAGALDPV